MKKMTWKCPNCWTEYEIDEKFTVALNSKQDCKFCVRKYPNIPTTAEMDGLLTKEDMRNRFDMVFQCNSCNKWTLHPNYSKTHTYLPCSNCSLIAYDSSSMKSYRTYNADTDNKRRPQAKKKKR